VPEHQLQLGVNEDYAALADAWEQVLQALEQCVNKPSFENWVKTAKPLSLENGVARIGTTSGFARGWLEKKHSAVISEILECHLGTKVRVKFELLEEEEPALIETQGKLPKKPKALPKPIGEDFSAPLNSRYNFDSFVVGPNNRLAHACAVAVASQPGKTYNPLFVYGGAGLGKTHLLHAVGRHLNETVPGTTVVYVPGETFTYHYVSALREHRIDEFRRKYRKVDVFLVDDIQFLSGKDRTEEEFFHTYNAIYDMGKQIVLTSDRAPKDIELDSRLLSRFECGMVTDISPPDLETRMAILQNRATLEHLELSNEVILYIARLITSNIRQLEGALVKLHAYASLMQTPVTAALAEEVLSDYFGQAATRVLDVAVVQKSVAERFHCKPEELTGKSRSKDIVMARQVAMYLARELTECSLPAIGKEFEKDHTTVLHSCKKVEDRLKTDKDFAVLLEDLGRALKDGITC